METTKSLPTVKALTGNRQLFWFCMAVTFLWGMAAHAGMFLSAAFAHDSLIEFNAAIYGDEWRLQLGRIFVPYYRWLTRGVITLPWLIGVVGLCFIGFSVFLTASIFDIHAKEKLALMAGIFTVNITITATIATYIHDFDTNMLALLLSVLAVFLWKKTKWGSLLGAVCIGVVLGVYPAYLSTAITLILISLVMDILDGTKFMRIFQNGWKAVGMLVLGGLLYLLAVPAVQAITGVGLVTDKYNSLNTAASMSVRQIISTAVTGYKKVIYDFSHQKTLASDGVIELANNAIVLICGAVVGLRLLAKKIGWLEKLAALALMALLPLGMNIVYALTAGVSHDLMHFAIWLIYLFALLSVWKASDFCKRLPLRARQALCAVPMILVSVVLWVNLQTANETYLRKNTEYEANLSYFTRVLSRMESCEDYVPGETPVVFVGTPEHMFKRIPGFEKEHDLTGMWVSYALNFSSRQRIQAYFDYVLPTPIQTAEAEAWEQMLTNSTVQQMPAYPQQGCVQMVDGILVVKLANI